MGRRPIPVRALAPHRASAFGGTLLSTLIPALAAVTSSVTLARTLGPFARGEMAAILLWPLVLGILGDPGVSFALSFLVSRDRESATGLWTIGLLVAFVWGGVLAVAGGAILTAALPMSGSALPALRLALASVPLTLVLSFGCHLLLGCGRLGASNLVRGSGLVLYAAGVVALAASGRGSLLTYAAAWVAAQGAASLLAAVLVLREVGGGLRWRPDLWSPVFSYGARVYASAIAAQASLRLDQLMMSVLGLTAQLGVYVVAVSVASATGPFFSALAIVALHRATASSSGLDAARDIRGVLRACLFLGVPMIAAASLLAWPLVPAVFGRPYAHAVLPAQILLVATFFQGANAILGNTLRGLGLPGRPAAAEGLGSLLTVCLLVWLLPRFGALGAAAASLVAYGLVAFVQFRFVQKATGLTAREILRRDASLRELLRSIFAGLRRGEG